MSNHNFELMMTIPENESRPREVHEQYAGFDGSSAHWTLTWDINDMGHGIVFVDTSEGIEKLPLTWGEADRLQAEWEKDSDGFPETVDTYRFSMEFVQRFIGK